MKQHALSSAVLSKWKTTSLLATISLCVFFPGTNFHTFAEDQPVPAENEAVDEDEQLDLALRKFGYVSGQACQLQEGDKRAKAEEKALNIANRILRFFGSDHAFHFAAAFGAGLVADIDEADHDTILEDHTKMLSELSSLVEAK